MIHPIIASPAIAGLLLLIAAAFAGLSARRGRRKPLPRQ